MNQESHIDSRPKSQKLCIILLPFFWCAFAFIPISVLAGPGSANHEPKSKGVSLSVPLPAKNEDPARKYFLETEREMHNSSLELAEFKTKLAEIFLNIAAALLGIIALAGLGGGLALPSIIKQQLIDDDKLKRMIEGLVHHVLKDQSKEYQIQLNLFKAHIDIGLAFSNGEILANSEIDRLLSILADHLNVPAQGIATAVLWENMGKLADIACRIIDHPRILSDISELARKHSGSDSLLARRLMEHHGSEILRGVSQGVNLVGFRHFAGQCMTAFGSELSSLSLAWQLVVYDNIYPALFQEVLAAAQVMPEPSRRNIGVKILKESKSFRSAIIRDEFEVALGKPWFFQSFDLMA